MGIRYTDLIRNAIDEFIPAAVRDNKFLMYPFFRLWFHGQNDIHTLMDFKSKVHSMTETEFREIYANFRNLDSDRETDSSMEAMNWVKSRIKDDVSETLIDIGCGKGIWLEKCASLDLKLTGLDIFLEGKNSQGDFIQANVDRLPFADKSYDIVTSFFMLEHVRNVEVALNELKRITRKQLFIAVPCQRYFKYTFDLHLHFFYSPEYFKSVVGIEKSECEQLGKSKVGYIMLHADLSD